MSFTYAVDVVPLLGTKLRALCHLAVGHEQSDVEQTVALAGAEAACLPALRELVAVSGGLARLDAAARRRRCDGLVGWAQAHAALQRVTVYYAVNAHTAAPLQDLRYELPTRHGRGPLLLTVARLPLALLTAQHQLEERVRFVTREIDPPPPDLGVWILDCARQLLSLLHTWRLSGCQRLLQNALELLVLFARWDHSANLEVQGQQHAFARHVGRPAPRTAALTPQCRLICDRGVAGFLFVMLRDAAAAALHTTEAKRRKVAAGTSAVSCGRLWAALGHSLLLPTQARRARRRR